MTNFEIEEALIDDYVEQKISVESELIAVRLIKEHFLPQGRLEEARLWKNELTSKTLRAECEQAIAATKGHPASQAVVRIPANTTWSETSAIGAMKKTTDQQYHYNRAVSYLTASEALVDDREDVETCRNEWVTFVARNMISAGASELGAEFDTLAMGVSDYVEYILLSDLEPDDELDHLAETPDFASVSKACAARPDIIEVLARSQPSLLKSGFVTNFVEVTTQVDGGKSEEVVVTTEGVAFLRKKFLGSLNGDVFFIPASKISNFEIGSELHTQHHGMSSTTTNYWILTLNTTDYQSYSRWMLLGTNEAEVNQNKPSLVRSIQATAEIYPVEEGESWQSSGGYTTSYGIIF